MKNPYFIDEPAAISFSGGRTSAYMLYRILEAHDGKLPDFVKVTFANTGKDMPETLDFVEDCSRQWGVDIVWLEGTAGLAPEDDRRKYEYGFRVVDHKTASRQGQPFEQLVKVRQYLPNPVARFCTKELKLIPIKKYMESIGHEEYTNIIGIRGDEPSRAIKLHGKRSEGNECWLPLYVDNVTKEDVYDFWMAQPFDLNLPNNNGTTDWGNCDLCFLKGFDKKLSIIAQRPDLADWWARMEEESPHRDSFVNTSAFFRKDHPSYSEMKYIATSQQGFDFGDDETIPCFCGD